MSLPLLPSSLCTLMDSGILIVEPHTGIRGARTLLLTAAAKQLSGFASLESESAEHPVRLAVLSHSLGVEMLRSVAHDIRVQWPKARILILGSIQLTLEDHLYDAAISDRPSSEELLGAIMMLASSPWSQVSDFDAAGVRSRDVTARGSLPRQRVPRESDPRKVVEAALAEQVAIRTLPRAASRPSRAS